MPFGWHLEMCLQEKQVDLVLDNRQELTGSSRPSSTIRTKDVTAVTGALPLNAFLPNNIESPKTPRAPNIIIVIVTSVVDGNLIDSTSSGP